MHPQRNSFTHKKIVAKIHFLELSMPMQNYKKDYQSFTTSLIEGKLLAKYLSIFSESTHSIFSISSSI